MRIPPMPITCSGMPITDSKACRSPWRRAEVHKDAGGLWYGVEGTGWRGSSSSDGPGAGGVAGTAGGGFSRGVEVGRRASDGLYGGLCGSPGTGLALEAVDLPRIRGIRTHSGRRQPMSGRPHGPLGTVFPTSRPRSRGETRSPRHARAGPSRDQASPGTARASFVESYSLLMEPPLRVILWALLRSLSRMASPKVGSPTTSCQCSTGTWLASSVPRRA